MSIPAGWSEAQVAAYTFRAELRAVEEGHHARRLADGRLRVVSHEEPDVAYYLGWTLPRGGVLHVSCTCPSGEHRAYLPVPCKHAALVARRLERERDPACPVEWRDGLWRDRRPAVCRECGAFLDDDGLPIEEHAPTCPIAPPDDPFEGLD